MELLINLDVPDIDAAIAFYTSGLGLHVGRKLDDGFVELLGGTSPIYLLQNDAGTPAFSNSRHTRSYLRHWCPVHLDFIVRDIESAINKAVAAGATIETPLRMAVYGRIATLADPFGHGFCLIEFNEDGYDAYNKKPASTIR